MAINFSEARLLSYNRQNNFFGEVFRYAGKSELTIEGSLYALTNQSGVQPIWSGMSGFVGSATDYDAVILNGTNFGSGRVNSLEFRPGVDVRLKPYTANITVFETGNLFNMTGPYYSGLNFNYPEYPVHLVDNFSENFDFNIKDDGSYSYRQTVNVRFVSGKLATNTKSPIDMARGFASGLLFSSPAFGFVDQAHSGWYTQPGRRTYTENYNLITNECSFSENFDLDFPSGNYSIKFAHEINTNENGVTNVTENGHIKGLYVDYYQNAEAGYQAELPQFYNRSSEAMNFYVPSGYPLVNAHVTLQKRINKIDGELDYTITYTNDPNFNITYTWEYTQELERRSNTCFYLIKENGKIQGLDGNCLWSARDSNALAAWDVIKTGIQPRLVSFYTGSLHLNNPLKAVSLSQKHSPYRGQIDYDSTYTDDLYYGISPGIKRVDFQIEDNRPVLKVNTFNILNVRQLIQKSTISTEGKYNISVKVIGERGAGLSTCFDAATGVVLDNRCTGLCFISEAPHYSFIPYEATLDFKMGWTYIQNLGDRILL